MTGPGDPIPVGGKTPQRNKGFVGLLVFSLAVALLILTFWPNVMPHWAPYVLGRGIGWGSYYALVFALSLAWLVSALLGLGWYGRKGRWLLLGAPLGLSPFLSVIWLFVACLVYGECL